MKNNKPLLLIVEDNDEYRLSLINSIILRDFFDMAGFSNCEDAYGYLIKNSEEVDLILLDHDFREYGSGNQMFGLALLDIINKKWPDIPVVMMSGIKDYRGQVAIDSIKKMAVEFLDKPILNLEKLIEIYSNCKKERCVLENNIEEIKNKLNNLGFVTQNKKILNRIYFGFESLKKQEDRAVTIVGETGSGKTYLAKILARLICSDENKIKILHCSHLGNDVNSIKDVLFGHKKGAFTSAVENKEGILSQAKFVIFDDIHHLSIESQKILLQVIQERIYSPLGDENRKLSVNSQFIFTTIKSPDELLNSGFLEEFVNRINAEVIFIPPLYQRIEDIRFIINKLNSQIQSKKITFDGNLIKQITNNIVSGEIKNIRELKVLIDDLIIHSDSNYLTLLDFKKIMSIKNEKSKQIANFNFFDDMIYEDFNLEQYITKIRRDAIITALNQTQGNIKKASELLGYKNHNGLSHWIKKMNIDVNIFKNKL